MYLHVGGCDEWTAGVDSVSSSSAQWRPSYIPLDIYAAVTSLYTWYYIKMKQVRNLISYIDLEMKLVFSIIKRGISRGSIAIMKLSYYICAVYSIPAYYNGRFSKGDDAIIVMYAYNAM